MAIRGRKPTSAAEKEVTGNPGKRSFVVGEIRPKGSVKKPKFLKGRASKIWDELSPKVLELGTLTSLSSYQFALYCNLVAQLEKNPDTFNASKITQMTRLASNFGMDGDQRVIPRPDGSEKPEDPAEKYF